MQKSTQITIILFMVCVCCIVTSPIKTTIVIPNRHDVFCSVNQRLHFVENFPHQSHKIFSWVAVDCHHPTAFVHRKFLHHSFYHWIWIVIEFLEVMTKISHNMSTLQYPLQKLVLVTQITNIRFFRSTHIIVWIRTQKLILETMDCPTNMSWKSTVEMTIIRLSTPHKLSLVLQKDMLVRSFHKVALDSQMSKYGQSALRVAEGIGSNGYFGVIVELFFEKMKA